jgi:hypothetical protein
MRKTPTGGTAAVQYLASRTWWQGLDILKMVIITKRMADIISSSPSLVSEVVELRNRVYCNGLSRVGGVLLRF